MWEGGRRPGTCRPAIPGLRPSSPRVFPPPGPERDLPQEIVGPVVCCHPVEDEADAIRLATTPETAWPLTLWTLDLSAVTGSPPRGTRDAVLHSIKVRDWAPRSGALRPAGRAPQEGAAQPGSIPIPDLHVRHGGLPASPVFGTEGILIMANGAPPPPGHRPRVYADSWSRTWPGPVFLGGLLGLVVTESARLRSTGAATTS